MLSLLRLHCPPSGARWAAAWQKLFGLAEPHATPGTLATALLRVLAEAESRATPEGRNDSLTSSQRCVT
jgi:hypothetical protein